MSWWQVGLVALGGIIGGLALGLFLAFALAKTFFKELLKIDEIS